MIETPLRDELQRLKVEAEAAGERAAVAKLRQRGDAYWKPAREVTAELRAYLDLVQHRKPEATPEGERPAREREITDAICEEVRERGLTFTLVENSATLQIVDPSIDHQADAAFTEQRAAGQAVKDFERENAEGLADEGRRLGMEEIRDALDGDDPDALKEALNR